MCRASIRHDRLSSVRSDVPTGYGPRSTFWFTCPKNYIPFLACSDFWTGGCFVIAVWLFLLVLSMRCLGHMITNLWWTNILVQSVLGAWGSGGCGWRMNFWIFWLVPRCRIVPLRVNSQLWFKGSRGGDSNDWSDRRSLLSCHETDHWKKVTIILLEQYCNLVGVLKYLTCSIVFYISLVYLRLLSFLFA